MEFRFLCTLIHHHLQTSVKTNLTALFEEWAAEEIKAFTPIAVSGSNRQYYRISGQSKHALGVYNPDVRENEAFIYLSQHFLAQGLPVPAVLAQALAQDIYLVQDFGDLSLYSMLSADKHNDKTFSPATKEMYKKVVAMLPRFQVLGHDNLDYTQCYPRPAFDIQSMLWDLNYFKYYFVKLAGISFDEQKLEEDFQSLCQYLLKAGSDHFLYRDFQSRNIMIFENEPYFIDFQGGRKGALQYDLASLLFDGKADLSPEFREALLNSYMLALQELAPTALQNFREFFYPFVYIRIIQAMGAYGFRGFYERKEHFLQSIPFALRNLSWLLENEPLKIAVPELQKVLVEITHSEFLRDLNKKKLIITINSFSYKYGIPADNSGNGGGFVFDCRALPNPGRYPEYQSLNGKDTAVKDFLNAYPEVTAFFDNVLGLVNHSIDTYLSRGFTHLMLNFGCTGGQHRSVFMAESLAATLASRDGTEIQLFHREQRLAGKS